MPATRACFLPPGRAVSSTCQVADPNKFVRCVKERLCWVCGEQLSRYASFVLGPMCCVTQTTADPPMHYECAHYALKACPFLIRPLAHRRQAEPAKGLVAAGCRSSATQASRRYG